MINKPHLWVCHDCHHATGPPSTASLPLAFRISGLKEAETSSSVRICKPGWESLSEGATQIETQITKTALKRKKKKALAGIQCLLCTKALTKQELKIALNELNGLNDSEKAKSGNMTKGKHIRGKET